MINIKCRFTSRLFCKYFFFELHQFFFKHFNNGKVLINDGIHRVYAARKRGRKINVVLARNVPSEYPYYAYALEDGWAQVRELAELQEGYQKKEYRNPENYKALFRDFNAVFEGVQKQRPLTNPAHLKA